MLTSDFLTLHQWLSPAYPLGSFAYSHGLETEIASGRVHNAAGLEAWLTDVLRHGAGRTDAILIRAAARGQTKAAETLAHTLAASSERLRETCDQGQAFQRTTAAIWGGSPEPLTFPVAFGAALARQSLPVTLGVALYLQAFASNLTSCAVRLVPLGQTEGQAVLSRLSPLCQAIADDTKNLALDDIGTATFLSDIASMQHETLQPRIFRT